jgi:hypothetical protein
MSPRRAPLIGLVFVVIALGYLAFQVAIGAPHVDLAGMTLLLALGAATGLMAWVLASGFTKG